MVVAVAEYIRLSYVNVQQISVQLAGETRRQIAALAEHWGLPRQRHNTPVIERAVAMAFMLEMGYDAYTERRREMEHG